MKCPLCNEELLRIKSDEGYVLYCPNETCDNNEHLKTN